MSETIQQSPGIHLELSGIVAATLVDEGVDPGQAQALSQAIVERVRNKWGGQQLYFPRAKFTVEYMRAEAARRWNGQNTRELCEELGVSSSRLRQLVDESLARLPKPA